LPIDEIESKRLDLQHHIFHLTLEGNLFRAPLDLERVRNVLDMGTGTGFWAIDFAKLYPQTKIVGSDVSSLERPRSYVKDDLPNLTFVLANAEEEWKFEDRFDYIHGRMMTVVFKDVKRVFQHAFDSLQPGGWLEMQDPYSAIKSKDGSIDGTTWEAVTDKWVKSGEARGVPFGTEPPNYKRYMEEIGFVDVHEEVLVWPTGPWMEDQRMKEIGKWWKINHVQAWQAFHRRSTAVGEAKENEDAELEKLLKDIMNPEIHGYVDL